jgi:hypothetical protein
MNMKNTDEKKHTTQTVLTVHEGVSVPAAQLNEERLQQQRWGKIANYQWVNFALWFVVGILLYNQVTLKQAYRANTEALRHFHPLVVRENELGQTQLVTRQGVNFSPDERAVRSALQFWATYHLGRMRATVQDFYGLSFLWMSEEYGGAIRQADQQTEWMKKFLKEANQQQYKVIVKNVVLKKIKEQDGTPVSGTADIFAYRQRYSIDGLEEPRKDSDAFVVHAVWTTAIDVPNDIQGYNPLGIAVTHHQIFNSLE